MSKIAAAPAGPPSNKAFWTLADAWKDTSVTLSGRTVSSMDVAMDLTSKIVAQEDTHPHVLTPFGMAFAVEGTDWFNNQNVVVSCLDALHPDITFKDLAEAVDSLDLNVMGTPYYNGVELKTIVPQSLKAAHVAFTGAYRTASPVFKTYSTKLVEFLKAYVGYLYDQCEQPSMQKAVSLTWIGTATSKKVAEQTISDNLSKTRNADTDLVWTNHQPNSLYLPLHPNACFDPVEPPSVSKRKPRATNTFNLSPYSVALAAASVKYGLTSKTNTWIRGFPLAISEATKGAAAAEVEHNQDPSKPNAEQWLTKLKHDAEADARDEFVAAFTMASSQVPTFSVPASLGSSGSSASVVSGPALSSAPSAPAAAAVAGVAAAVAGVAFIDPTAIVQAKLGDESAANAGARAYRVRMHEPHHWVGHNVLGSIWQSTNGIRDKPAVVRGAKAGDLIHYNTGLGQNLVMANTTATHHVIGQPEKGTFFTGVVISDAPVNDSSPAVKPTIGMHGIVNFVYRGFGPNGVQPVHPYQIVSPVLNAIAKEFVGDQDDLTRYVYAQTTVRGRQAWGRCRLVSLGHSMPGHMLRSILDY